MPSTILLGSPLSRPFRSHFGGCLHARAQLQPQNPGKEYRKFSKQEQDRKQALVVRLLGDDAAKKLSWHQGVLHFRSGDKLVPLEWQDYEQRSLEYHQIYRTEASRKARSFGALLELLGNELTPGMLYAAAQLLRLKADEKKREGSV
ncbi:hypothetical protein WJX72_010478 [[Myrmecia] bisecta]|uniref:Uncharacterized protein n=1 Tax=[Myrmecia] bisecta TaxID=41462 RepID=A0AAW1P410_9CHLO